MKPATIFLDLDGCVFKHSNLKERLPPEVLPGVVDKFWEWHSRAITIILVTGRPESMREQTERDLRAAGLFWDKILFGCGSGPRYLINDMKNNNTENSAFGINVERDAGLYGVDL